MGDLFEAMKAAAARWAPAPAQAFFAYVSSYDPATHSVKVKLPMVAGGTDTGAPVETGWIPLATPAAGGGWGIQVAPALDGKDQVIIIVAGNQFVALGPFYHDQHQTPGPSVAAGDIWLQHKTGTILKFTGNGDVTLIAAAGSNLHLQTSGGGKILCNSG